MAHTAVEMAKDIDAAAIITCTKSGSTTRLVARYRPRQTLLAMTPEREDGPAHGPGLRRRAAADRRRSDSAEDLERLAIDRPLQGGYVKPGHRWSSPRGCPSTWRARPT